eukprot:TRINITY_DN93538_c0_g1_i1.p1 TRINITY_DN93538_c0_g1~~TRINITY_DN93538_c0_g1_i1.p1  ORF type:complete len:252 (-),score=36.41 TRINITY_DN93538_c0_g1_i1:296-1051(-)
MFRSRDANQDVSQSSSFASVEAHSSFTPLFERDVEQDAPAFSQANFRSMAVTDVEELLNTGREVQIWKAKQPHDPTADNGTYSGSLQRHLMLRRLQITGESVCLSSWNTSELKARASRQDERDECVVNTFPSEGSNSDVSCASLEVRPPSFRSEPEVMPKHVTRRVAPRGNGRRYDADDELLCEPKMPIPPKDARPDRVSKIGLFHRRLGLAKYVPWKTEPQRETLQGSEPSDLDSIPAAGSALQAARRLK